MKSQCPISGIEFPTPEFSWIRQNQVLHPIFNLPAKQLLAQAGKWAAGETSPSENKLLFLALLRTTELIDFKSIACPSDATVQKNMQLVMNFASWKSASFHGQMGETKNFSMAKYTVQYPSTHTMENIRTYLDIWLNKVSDLEKSYSYRQEMLSEGLKKREEALARLIHSSMRRNGFERKLGIWALTVAGYDKEDFAYEYALRLFQLKEPEIFSNNLRSEKLPFKVIEDYGPKPLSPLCQDLINLLHIMETELEVYTVNGSLQSLEVLKHLRNLIALNRKGPASYYGVLDDVSLSASPEYLKRLKASVANAPKEQPIKSDYPSLIAYVKAKAIWGEAQEYKRVIEEKHNALKEQMKQETITASIIAEDAEIENLEDLDEVFVIEEKE